MHRVYIEQSAESVAAILSSENADEFDFCEIEIDPEAGTAQLHPVALKAERRPAPAREIAEIEANGAVVGATEVDASA